MGSRKIIVILISLFLSWTNIFSQSVTLTSNRHEVIVNKSGTVTFSGSGATLESKAKEWNLGHVSGRTYQAAIVYEIAFSSGLVSSRGKIFNCTDNEIGVSCAFYNGNNLVATHNITVKPRTFSRMLPDDFSISSINNCSKVVCTETGVSNGYSTPYSGHRDSGSTSANTRSYFSKETNFHGEDAKSQLGVTYYPDGTCYFHGYVLDDDTWIKVSCQGCYYIKSGILFVTWSGSTNETYRLHNNQYIDGGIVFKLRR